MLPTMHTGNIYTLEIPSWLINTNAYMDNILLFCADTVLHRER